MVSRAAAIFLLAFAVASTRAQDVFNDSLNGKMAPKSIASAFKKLESAWLDLRQLPSSNSKPQDCPSWIEAVSIVPGKKTPGLPETTVFRIRLLHPNPEAQVL